jgi:hypothetical protein
MFPLFAVIFALSAGVALAGAAVSVKRWLRIREPSYAHQYRAFAFSLGFLGGYFTALSLPVLLGFDRYAVAFAYTAAQPLFFAALTAGSYTVLGFPHRRLLATVFFLTAGFWLTYWRVLDFEPAARWVGYGFVHFEPLLRPLHKLLVAAVALTLLVPMVRRARALSARDQEPFSRRQFHHFWFGAVGLLGSVLAYHVLGALDLLSIITSLLLAAPLSLVGVAFFARGLRLEPYVPEQFERVGGVLRRTLP